MAYLESVVTNYGGADLWERIHSKPRGGKAGDDGFRMEHYFAIFKIAAIAAALSADEDQDESRREHADVAKYVPCLVDDLRIRDGSVAYYQLKWGRVRLGEVLNDIRDQAEIDRLHGQTASYNVVVRTPRRVSILRSKANEKKIPLTPVLFPFGRKWLPFCEAQPLLRENLATVSGDRCENTLEHLFKLISANWIEVDQCNVMDFIDSIASSYPFLFASRAVSSPAFDELRELLAPLDIEAYNFPRLKFVMNGSAVLPSFQCDDDDFVGLIKWLREKPRSQQEVLLRFMGIVL
ncbi:hypothetical protein AB9E06_06025 [Rhizobium leguminosarum]|uniref:hypothetical protein n=1 Tax=Rhizobium leguminosarum TaxID=384 RepID=UPI003F95118A